MPLSVKFSEDARKAIRELHIDAQKDIKKELKRLASGEIKGKDLVAQLLGFSSLKVNNYRIIYRKLSEEIIVYFVGHRSKVYSNFKG